jgi:hypothetical protein
MDIKGIISISGRAGLYKIITQGKNAVIVESLLDKKRFPAYATEKISSIEDISIFTTDEDVLISEVFKTMLDLYTGGEAESHKADEKALRIAFSKILSNYDMERVYFSDIRKVFQWYNLLIKEGILKLEPVETEVPTTEGEASTVDEETAEIKPRKKRKLPTSLRKTQHPRQQNRRLPTPLNRHSPKNLRQLKQEVQEVSKLLVFSLVLRIGFLKDVSYFFANFGNCIHTQANCISGDVIVFSISRLQVNARINVD